MLGGREGEGEGEGLLIPHIHTMTSRVNKKTFVVGEFVNPTLAELRRMGRDINPPPPPSHRASRRTSALSLSYVSKDVSVLQADPSNRFGVFQAASQFNCLEFVGPGVVPEDGVTGYIFDRTQGPACRWPGDGF
jgi:hypothetical protein